MRMGQGRVLCRLAGPGLRDVVIRGDTKYECSAKSLVSCPDHTFLKRGVWSGHETIEN